jgi:hypothetical protein
MENSKIQVENQIENLKEEIKKIRGRPRLTEEEKLIRKQKNIEYQKKYKLEHKEKINQQNMEYSRKNKDKVKESHHKYYLNNKDKFVENNRKYKQKIKDIIEEKETLINELINKINILNSYENN